MAPGRAFCLATSRARAGLYYTTTNGRPKQYTRYLVSLSMRAASEENPNLYCEGGYHPVRIGDAFNRGRYKVINKLGYGVYSTVWLASDQEAQKHVALKILTAGSFGKGNDTFELDILRKISAIDDATPGRSHVVPLLDNFDHRGVHGDHVTMIFKAMGPDMTEFRRLFHDSRIPIPMMRKISKQLLLALSFLHDTCGVIHTDIKPSNILVETAEINEMLQKAPSEAFAPSPSSVDPERDYYIRSTQVSSADEDLANAADLSVRLADFGTASWKHRHLAEWIQPQMLRAPEVILKAEWDHKVDIWNLGVIIWELAEGQLLFDGSWTARVGYAPEPHLAQMESFFGEMPGCLLDRSADRHLYYDAKGNLLQPSTFAPRTLEQCSRNSGLVGSDREDFFRFIKSMVRLDPEQRLEARDLLRSPWLSR